MQASHVRHGFGSIRPYVYGAMDTAALVLDVFQAEVLERIDGPNNAHIEARIDDAMIVLEVADPPHPSGTPASIYIYVPDVDETVWRASAAGFEVVAPVSDKPYRERSGGLKDRYGNTWYVSTFTG